MRIVKVNIMHIKDIDFFTKRQNLILDIQGYIIGISISLCVFQLFYGKSNIMFYIDIIFSIIFIISSVLSHIILRKFYKAIKGNPQYIDKHKDITNKYLIKPRPYKAFILLISLFLFGLFIMFLGIKHNIYLSITAGLFIIFYVFILAKESFLFYKNK